jgi:uncharacterized membrane protein YgdD (TMEM256/DUF423 family)
MNSAVLQRVVAIVGAVGVALGALSAHGPTADYLAAHNMLPIWYKGLLYYFAHVLALLALCQRPVAPRWTVIFFLAGLLLFSTNLFIFAFTQNVVIRRMVPVGGVSFIIGWLTLLFDSSRRQEA